MNLSETKLVNGFASSIAAWIQMELIASVGEEWMPSHFRVQRTVSEFVMWHELTEGGNY